MNLKNNRINYYNRDFSSIRNDLVNYAKSYFPYYANDFTEASPSMMFVDLVSYVGDILSFYIDKQIQETFITTATDRENIIQLANFLGYNHKTTTPSSVTLTVSQLLPAKVGAPDEADFNYGLVIKEGSIISTNDGSGISFRTLTDLNFSLPIAPTSSDGMPTSNYPTIFETVGNTPLYYLIKKEVNASSAFLATETFYFPQNTEPNPSIKINRTNVIEILDVTDSDGNVWYEVPYLAQQTVFESIKNSKGITDPTLYTEELQTPYMLKSMPVNKKFIRRTTSDNFTELIFGSGVSSREDLILYPNQENLNSSFYTSNVNNKLLDPTNFIYLGNTGEIPRNTTLTVRYYYGGGFTSNVGANTITNIDSLILGEMSVVGLDTAVLNFIMRSVSFDNTFPALGGRGVESNEEIRQNALAFFNAQNRCVTEQDYMIRALSLPSKYGNIAKAFTTKTSDVESPILLFCLSYDANKNFVQLNTATKINLSTYLNHYRVLSDSIEIKETVIINIGVKFDIVVLRNYNHAEVLKNCIIELQKYFDNDNMQINQPIYLSEVHSILNSVDGVQVVKSTNIVNKVGEPYSSTAYTIDNAMRNNILYPAMQPPTQSTIQRSIFEVKYPNIDIEGKVSPY